MSTLWQWAKNKDTWLWAAEAAPEKKAVILRGHKRRNPAGTVFRWTETGEPPARKYRQRAAKQATEY